MKIYIPLYQFIVLAISTAIMTYFFNVAAMGGQYFLMAFLGFFLLRNVHASYQLSRFIRILEEQNTKKK